MEDIIYFISITGRIFYQCRTTEDLYAIIEETDEVIYEEWRPIPEKFRLKLDNYLISNLGRIRNLRNTNKSNIIEGFIKKKGHIATSIIDNDGKRVDCIIHRLMVLAFLEIDLNRIKKLVIRHINGNKSDNRLSNFSLRYLN